LKITEDKTVELSLVTKSREMSQPETPCPFTPVNKKLLKVSESSSSASSPAVHIPATPFLKKLGYGTGVSVFLYSRSPSGEKFRSPWAVKKVNRRHALSQFGDRLEEEAKVLKSLSHPNIIGFRGFNKKEDGTHSLVMEDGHKSLLDIIDERSEQEEEPFSVPVIESVIEKVASALNYLHTEKQILHGDIKSGNVLVVADFQNVKLCDFGVTLPLNEDGVVSDPDRKYVGTEAWSPMEVIKDDAAITSKADIFAFGLLIYEMLALHSPHVDKLVIDDEDDDAGDESINEEEFRAALGTRPPLPDHLELDSSYRRILEIFFAATNEDPKQRPSAKEILDLLEREEDRDDSILCINMVRGDDNEPADCTVDLDTSSVICIDDSVHSTPPAS